MNMKGTLLGGLNRKSSSFVITLFSLRRKTQGMIKGLTYVVVSYGIMVSTIIEYVEYFLSKLLNHTYFT